MHQALFIFVSISMVVKCHINIKTILQKHAILIFKYFCLFVSLPAKSFHKVVAERRFFSSSPLKSIPPKPPSLSKLFGNNTHTPFTLVPRSCSLYSLVTSKERLLLLKRLCRIFDASNKVLPIVCFHTFPPLPPPPFLHHDVFCLILSSSSSV